LHYNIRRTLLSTCRKVYFFLVAFAFWNLEVCNTCSYFKDLCTWIAQCFFWRQWQCWNIEVVPQCVDVIALLIQIHYTFCFLTIYSIFLFNPCIQGSCWIILICHPSTHVSHVGVKMLCSSLLCTRIHIV